MNGSEVVAASFIVDIVINISCHSSFPKHILLAHHVAWRQVRFIADIMGMMLEVVRESGVGWHPVTSAVGGAIGGGIAGMVATGVTDLTGTGLTGNLAMDGAFEGAMVGVTGNMVLHAATRLPLTPV